MKVLKEIVLKVGNKDKTIYFGLPDNDKELEEMYKFRYRVYLKHNYIIENIEGRDVDEYDNGRSIYFIAKIDNRIIGTVRLIQAEYLPTEKDCFNFQEPLEISKIPRNQRAELSRLIVEHYDKKVFLPRHLVMLGLLSVIMVYALENNINGGYSFIKDSLKVKLNKLDFPFYSIKNFRQVYNKGILNKYFNDNTDLVWPIYYLTAEIVPYFDKIFGKKIFFRKKNSNKIFFKNQLLFKFLQKINAL